MNTSHNSPAGFDTSFVNTPSNRARSLSGVFVSSPMTKVCSPPFAAACFHRLAAAENCSPYCGSPAAPMTRTSVRCSLVCACVENGVENISAMKTKRNIQQPKSNLAHRHLAGEFRFPTRRQDAGAPTTLDVRCWMLDVGCSLKFITAVLSNGGCPIPPRSTPAPSGTPPVCATAARSMFL